MMHLAKVTQSIMGSCQKLGRNIYSFSGLQDLSAGSESPEKPTKKASKGKGKSKGKAKSKTQKPRPKPKVGKKTKKAKE